MNDKEELYSNLCYRADEILSRYNPCKVTDGKCIRGHFCCNGCVYLIDNKCSIKSLLCKLWLCEKFSVNESVVSELKDIFDIALSNDLLIARGEYRHIKQNHSEETLFLMPWKKVYALKWNRDSEITT